MVGYRVRKLLTPIDHDYSDSRARRPADWTGRGSSRSRMTGPQAEGTTDTDAALFAGLHRSKGRRPWNCTDAKKKGGRAHGRQLTEITPTPWPGQGPLSELCPRCVSTL